MFLAEDMGGQIRETSTHYLLKDVGASEHDVAIQRTL